jgi:hypothetical protein
MRRRDFLLAAPASLLGIGSPRVRGASCILLVLTGGPSHLDTWDMKPDAPREIRGPFRPIRTNVPGIEISEIFPRMAKQAHRYTLIRSLHHAAQPDHDAALRTILTGLPQSIPRRDREGADDVQLRAKYGPTPFGQSCLQARRLIESGVRFVTVHMFDTLFDETTWDIHGWRPFSPICCYRDVVGPTYDMAYTALLDDLSERGLLDSTLVVSMGEFGRTPKINPSGGRDHWPHCFTIQMAGGGIRGGEIYGSSDATGAEPRDRPVSPANVVATIRKALGIAAVEPNAAEPLHELFS